MVLIKLMSKKDLIMRVNYIYKNKNIIDKLKVIKVNYG